MIELVVWTNYLIAAFLAFWRLKFIDPLRLTFFDGILVGQIYYLTVPMFFILIYGQISPQFILTDYYFPFKHVETTFVIISSMYFIAAIHTFFRPRKIRFNHREHNATSTMRLVFMIYIVCTMAIFFMSGLNEGGHWHENINELLTESLSSLIIKHWSNFARFAIFGILIYQYYNKIISIRTAIFIALIIVFSDLFLTFNRITAVYFIIMCFFLAARKKIIFAGMAATVIFVIPFVSNMWPMFRGIAVLEGYSLDSMLKAVEITLSHSVNTDMTFVEYMNGVFESINIPALNYVVNNKDYLIDQTNGSIYLRQFTIFVPRSIFPYKPDIFANVLGVSINNATNGLALNSTLIGEPFGNFGHLWPAFTLPMLFIYHFFFNIYSKLHPEFGGIAFFTAFAIWRFDFTIGTISTIFSGILFAYMMFSKNFTLKKLRRKPGSPKLHAAHQNIASRTPIDRLL